MFRNKGKGDVVSKAVRQTAKKYKHIPNIFI